MSKKPKLLWLQSLTCNGNSHSFFNHSDLFSILSHFELIHFPLIDTKYTLEDVLNKRVNCDILIIEGSIKHGLEKCGVDIATLIDYYANEAKYIITAGTCATFGGMFKEYDSDNIKGFAFDRDKAIDNFSKFREKLISLPGCPIHPKWLSYVLLMIANKKNIPLDDKNRPQELYSITVHTGCVRNEYFEWKIDTHGFGHKEGCSFYENGCQGPFTRGSCNKILWNDVSSKTIIGTPCFGCTEPDFPKERLFFTKTNMGIPQKMPLEVPKRAYLTITGVAKSFNIKRLERKLIEYNNDN